ncbi:thiamine-phosphate pyrophosphorylase [Methyloligella halotolerans]|uniref:Thiamine-phosphate pyrophosphorylase n=2 Tax=Methyloligella halotolerans TaxID=1177755 RepID=A0A1E2RZ90_9HYPH|nr:thiamine-phosphate pyrophosphorylase [Methyloligella halotolerans]
MHRRIYLQIPPAASAAAEMLLTNALERYPVASALLTGGDDIPFDTDWANNTRRICHQHDVAFLVEISPERAIATEADGIHMGPDRQAYEQARQVLGKNAIIGTHCCSRHDAMVLAELGTDYVAFATQMQSMTQPEDPVPDLIEWWSETFEIPCVAWNVESGEDARRALKSGADFLGITKKCFEADVGAAALSEIAAALESA